MVLNREQFDAFRMEIATFGNIPILSKYCGMLDWVQVYLSPLTQTLFCIQTSMPSSKLQQTIFPPRK